MKPNFISEIKSLLVDLWKRLVQARLWIVAQIAGMLILIGLGLAWTRIAEKNAGQVIFTILLPLLITAAFLWLQAGTIRSLLRRVDHDQSRTSILAGAALLLALIVIGFLLWTLIDRFDDHISLWAGYLNSRFNANSRSHFATYEHFSMWLERISWLLRWVIVPGLLLPFACASASRLRRFVWRVPFRIWMEWRWWPILLLLALIGQAWTGTFFDALPYGTVHAQVWRVILKVAANYILAVFCWLLALAWTAVLFSRRSGGVDGLESVAEPALLSPKGSRSDSVRLPLPDSE